MSPPGRPKGEYRSAQHEGTPVRVLHCSPMHRARFPFAFFWFSHRTGGGEANA
jgi:hypothetical protein